MRTVLTRGRLALAERLTPRQPAAVDAQAVLSALPVPVVVLDPSNGFRFANQAAEQFLGVSLLQLRNLSFLSLSVAPGWTWLRSAR